MTEEETHKLVKPYRLTNDERSKSIQAKGGKARQAKAREMRKWKDILNEMLSTQAPEKYVNKLKDQGVIANDPDFNTMILYTLISKALKGDISAIKEIKEITGNKEPDSVNVNLPVQIKVEDDYGD